MTKLFRRLIYGKTEKSFSFTLKTDEISIIKLLSNINLFHLLIIIMHSVNDDDTVVMTETELSPYHVENFLKIFVECLLKICRIA